MNLQKELNKIKILLSLGEGSLRQNRDFGVLGPSGTGSRQPLYPNTFYGLSY